jgi:Holliday junction DNA helicase RuvA
MIGFLQGQPRQLDDEALIMMVHGVGYELICSTNTLGDVAGQDRAELFVYTHVREDAIHLFGFSSLNEKRVFLSLLKVNGIGPKLAITILSSASVEKIISMIEAEDAKGLSQLPRVGKKTAEQIILSLKGKLVRAEEVVAQNRFSARPDIVSALVHLGFRVQDVEKVVDQMDAKVDVQTGVRIGLSALTN